MKSIPFPEANTRYVSPKDWDADKWGPCGDLWVYANQEDQTVTSCWKMTDEEYDAYQRGKNIYLTIHGGQPPVMLEVR